MGPELLPVHRFWTSDTLQSILMFIIYKYDTATFVFATVEEGDGWGYMDSNLHRHMCIEEWAEQLSRRTRNHPEIKYGNYQTCSPAIFEALWEYLITAIQPDTSLSSFSCQYSQSKHSGKFINVAVKNISSLRVWSMQDWDVCLVWGRRSNTYTTLKQYKCYSGFTN